MRSRPQQILPLMAILLILVGIGCERTTSHPGEATTPPGELPPTYTRDKIVDPKLAEVAQSFTDWARSQQDGTKPIFASVQVLPPAPTLLPYGIGTNQKEDRLPAILITGPGWSSLKAEKREALVARAFRDLSDRLGAVGRVPALRPSLTIQTPQGLELAWINQIDPGERYIHGEQP